MVRGAHWSLEQADWNAEKVDSMRGTFKKFVSIQGKYGFTKTRLKCKSSARVKIVLKKD